MTQPLTPPTKDGRSVPDGLSSATPIEPVPVSPLRASIPSALLALAERCEQALEPNRNLDAMIHARNGIEGIGYRADAPRFTESLDAALTLLPATDWEWSLEACEGTLLYSPLERQMVYTAKLGDPFLRMEAEAASGPIAFCAAALRAQAIEARRAETGTGSVHESAVPEGMRP